MGTSHKHLLRIQKLNELGLLAKGGSVIELGSQNLSLNTPEQQMVDFLKYFGHSGNSVVRPGGLMNDLLSEAGFKCHSLDIFPNPYTMIFDLNRDPTPEVFLGKADLVTNCGTTEHLLNQLHSFRVMHELTKTGGLMYHDLPFGGYHHHGYFNYNPLVFIHLALANDYELILEAYTEADSLLPVPEDMLAGGYPDKTFLNRGIEVILRKTSEAPFHIPLEISTSCGTTDNSILKGEESYRILKGNANLKRHSCLSEMASSFSHSSGGKKEISLRHVSIREIIKELKFRFSRRIKNLLPS